MYLLKNFDFVHKLFSPFIDYSFFIYKYTPFVKLTPFLNLRTIFERISPRIGYETPNWVGYGCHWIKNKLRPFFMPLSSQITKNVLNYENRGMK